MTGTGEISRRFVDARRVDEQKRNILMEDARGQKIQAVEVESGCRLPGSAIDAVTGCGPHGDGDSGLEDGLFQPCLAGDLVAVITETLAEVVELGKSHVAHVAVEAVLAGEGWDGGNGLAEDEKGENQAKGDGPRFSHNSLLSCEALQGRSA